MSKQYYGIATDSPLGIGEICKCDDFRIINDGWEMKIDGDWYDSYSIFYIDDNKIVYEAMILDEE